MRHVIFNSFLLLAIAIPCRGERICGFSDRVLFHSSDVAFSGKVWRVEQLDHAKRVTFSEVTFHRKRLAVTSDSISVWLLIKNVECCNYPFVEEQRYFVYASIEAGGQLETDECRIRAGDDAIRAERNVSRNAWWWRLLPAPN